MVNLSPREEQICWLIATEYLETKEIAYRLKIQSGSVKQYIYWLTQKFGFRNRVELAIWAYKRITEKELDL
jgi:DNA-binding CsgD family transcriptional regulator